MATYLAQVPGVIQHFIEQVYQVTPLGEGMNGWRYFDVEGSEQLEEVGADERLFICRVDRGGTVANPITWGNTESGYDVPFEIIICYHQKDYGTLAGLHDFEEIKRQIMTSDTSSLTGYNFARFEDYQWLPPVEEGSKYRFLRIPVTVRLSVTR